jgi:phage terminase small subunit
MMSSAMARKLKPTPIAHLDDHREVAFVIAFCGEAEGNASKAAEIAGYSDEFRRNAAYRLMRQPRVRKAIELSNRELWKAGIGDIIERQQILTEIMRDEKATKTARIRAIEVLGRMQGDFIGKGEDPNNNTQRTILLYPVPMQPGTDPKTLALPAGHAFDAVELPPETESDGESTDPDVEIFAINPPHGSSGEDEDTTEE